MPMPMLELGGGGGDAKAGFEATAGEIIPRFRCALPCDDPAANSPSASTGRPSPGPGPGPGPDPSAESPPACDARGDSVDDSDDSMLAAATGAPDPPDPLDSPDSLDPLETCYPCTDADADVNADAIAVPAVGIRAASKLGSDGRDLTSMDPEPDWLPGERCDCDRDTAARARASIDPVSGPGEPVPMALAGLAIC